MRTATRRGPNPNVLVGAGNSSPALKAHQWGAWQGGYVEWVRVYGLQPSGRAGRFRKLPHITWRTCVDLMCHAAPLPADRRALRSYTRRQHPLEEIRTAPNDLCLRLASSLGRQLSRTPNAEWFFGKHDGLYWRNAQGEFVISGSPVPGFVQGCSLSRSELRDWITFLLCCGGFVAHGRAVDPRRHYTRAEAQW